VFRARDKWFFSKKENQSIHSSALFFACSFYLILLFFNDLKVRTSASARTSTEGNGFRARDKWVFSFSRLALNTVIAKQ
jgi:hypothetical protein